MPTIEELRSKLNPVMLEYLDLVLGMKNNTADHQSHVDSTNPHGASAQPDSDALVLRDGSGDIAAKHLLLSSSPQCKIGTTFLAANRVHSIPDAGADAEFVMSKGNQSIQGQKNFASIYVPEPTNNGEAASKYYVDSGLAGKSDSSHDHNSSYVALTGNQSVGGVKTLTEIAKYNEHKNFLDGNDIVNKRYVDIKSVLMHLGSSNNYECPIGTVKGIAITCINDQSGTSPTLIIGDVVYVSGDVSGDAAVKKANPNARETMGAIGVCTNGSDLGLPAVVLTRGMIRNDAWNFTPGKQLYVSQSGTLTDIVPTVGVIQNMGVALNSKVAFIDPNNLLHDLGVYYDGGSVHGFRDVADGDFPLGYIKHAGTGVYVRHNKFNFSRVLEYVYESGVAAIARIPLSDGTIAQHPFGFSVYVKTPPNTNGWNVQVVCFNNSTSQTWGYLYSFRTSNAWGCICNNGQHIQFGTCLADTWYRIIFRTMSASTFQFDVIKVSTGETYTTGTRTKWHSSDPNTNYIYISVENTTSHNGYLAYFDSSLIPGYTEQRNTKGVILP